MTFDQKENITILGKDIKIGERYKANFNVAKYSGMFKPSIKLDTKMTEGYILDLIADIYGKLNYSVKATVSGYIINVNQSLIVYQGVALFHISTKLK
jgi:hypothetical protein